MEGTGKDQTDLMGRGVAEVAIDCFWLFGTQTGVFHRFIMESQNILSDIR